MLKGPEDLATLYQVLWHVRPRTIIEIGAFTGALALWMTNSLRRSNIECNVISIDLDLSLDPFVKSQQPKNLSFIEGDAKDLGSALSSDFLKEQPHPWLLVEDAHNYVENVMDYFHPHLTPGDYILCEGTSPNIPARIVHDDYTYNPLGPVKLQIWKQFVAKHGDTYAVDSFFTDLYGYNVGANWDGYVRRMK